MMMKTEKFLLADAQIWIAKPYAMKNMRGARRDGLIVGLLIGCVVGLYLGFSFSTKAEIVRTQCQSEQSRELRLIAKARVMAAKDADPWRGAGDSLPSKYVDEMNLVVKRLSAEASVALHEARAREAARCPQWETAIMEVGPATDEEKQSVAEVYRSEMVKNFEQLARLKAWQALHPQCKRVVWWKSFGLCSQSGKCSPPSGSIEDFSGKFEGKTGHCSADANGEAWRGSEDSLEKHDPETNDLIGKVACANALKKAGIDNRWYADPKFCAGL